ncbi:MAG: isoprenylcysteine carboxylmethyltransferase family protein [Alphaproteobacteria bacterium]|nr:isoprenylcysteine carboxylmethyltransferase family protein [Alphaproteobacteria bacterium]
MSLSETKDSPFDRSFWLDLAIRFALGVTFAFSAGVCLHSGISHMKGVDFAHPQPYQLGQAFSVLSIGLYSLMVAGLYAVRLRPISKFAGAIPCAAAILGGFLMSGLLLLSPCESLPLWARILACLLVVIGNAFAVMILLRLGRSFSILPEGRRLVTQGPYAVVRHPLYLAEAVATLGVVINFLSPWALLLVAVQLALQLVRIHYEEKVLTEHFPEYEAYAEKTARLIPGIY